MEKQHIHNFLEFPIEYYIGRCAKDFIIDCYLSLGYELSSCSCVYRVCLLYFELSTLHSSFVIISHLKPLSKLVYFALTLGCHICASSWRKSIQSESQPVAYKFAASKDDAKNSILCDKNLLLSFPFLN